MTLLLRCVMGRCYHGNNNSQGVETQSRNLQDGDVGMRRVSGVMIKGPGRRGSLNFDAGAWR